VSIYVYRDLNAAVPHLLLHIGRRNTGLNQERAERVPQVMEPELPKATLLQGWFHVTRADVVRADGSSRFRWKDKIIGNTCFAKLEGAEQSAFFMRHQDYAKLLAHVHPAALMGLGCAEMPHVVVPLHQDESVFIVL
jgi:hypothetical protein